MSFFVNRSKGGPGFGLVRQEVDNRRIRYTIYSYATDKLEGGLQFEVAGLIDRQRNEITIAGRFPEYVQRSTEAHELGYWLLHNNLKSYKLIPANSPRFIFVKPL